MGRWGLRISTASSALPLTRQSPAIGESPNIARCHLDSFWPPVRIIEDANKRAIRGHATVHAVWVVYTVAMSPYGRGRAMAAPWTPNVPFRRIATAIALHRYHSGLLQPRHRLVSWPVCLRHPSVSPKAGATQAAPTRVSSSRPEKLSVREDETYGNTLTTYSGMQSGCKKHHRAEASFR